MDMRESKHNFDNMRGWATHLLMMWFQLVLVLNMIENNYYCQNCFQLYFILQAEE